jgi:outer membrane protein OmpA-like peptidoglycan-associated protein
MKLSTLSTILSITLASGVAAAQAQYSEPQPQPAAPTEPQNQQQQPANQPQAAQPEQPMTAERVLPVDLLFDTNSSQLQGDAHAQLLEAATWAKCNPNGAVILEGHADPRGTQQHNLTLSGERAAAVRQKLIKMGVPSERIVIAVYGENGPRRATYREDRRVTVRAATTPISPDAITASR